MGYYCPWPEKGDGVGEVVDSEVRLEATPSPLSLLHIIITSVGTHHPPHMVCKFFLKDILFGSWITSQFPVFFCSFTFDVYMYMWQECCLESKFCFVLLNFRLFQMPRRAETTSPNSERYHLKVFCKVFEIPGSTIHCTLV